MSAAYLVIYRGEPEDKEAFLNYYLEKHLPIIWTWPRIRRIEVALGIAGRDDFATPADLFMIARFIFDNEADLQVALQSRQRQHARADSANFPKFKGTMRHQAVTILDVPKKID